MTTNITQRSTNAGLSVKAKFWVILLESASRVPCKLNAVLHVISR